MMWYTQSDPLREVVRQMSECVTIVDTNAKDGDSWGKWCGERVVYYSVGVEASVAGVIGGHVWIHCKVQEGGAVESLRFYPLGQDIGLCRRVVSGVEVSL